MLRLRSLTCMIQERMASWREWFLHNSTALARMVLELLLKYIIILTYFRKAFKETSLRAKSLPDWGKRLCKEYLSGCNSVWLEGKSSDGRSAHYKRMNNLKSQVISKEKLHMLAMKVVSHWKKILKEKSILQPQTAFNKDKMCCLKPRHHINTGIWVQYRNNWVKIYAILQEGDKTAWSHRLYA